MVGADLAEQRPADELEHQRIGLKALNLPIGERRLAEPGDRIGQFLVVPLGKAPDYVMVVAMPGAEVATPAVRARLAELMTTYELRYLPEQTAAILEPVVHEVGGTLVRVRDDADYFYDAQQLAALHGARGKAARRFEHRIEPSRVVIREGLLSDRWAFEHLLETQAVWAEKFAGHPPASIEQERRGIETWPRAAHGQRLRVFCLSVDGRPTGVSVVEPMYGSTWMGLVFKADPTVAGSAEFLRQHVAQQALLSLGSHGLICLQQDDGVLALRAMKESYRPKFMRDKLAVVLPGRVPSFPRVDAC